MFRQEKKNSLPYQTAEIVRSGITRRGKIAPRVTMSPAVRAGEGNATVIAPGTCKELQLSAYGYHWAFRDRFVLMHELAHARWTRPFTKSELVIPGPRALNAVEDGYVHAQLWRAGMTRAQMRDCITDLFNDIRSLLRAKSENTPEGDDWAVYVLPRIMVGLQFAPYANDTVISRHTRRSLRQYRDKVLQQFNGHADTITKIVELTVGTRYPKKTPVRAQAGRLLNTMFTPELPKPEVVAKPPVEKVEAIDGVKVHYKTLPLVSRTDCNAPTIFMASSGAIIRSDTLVRAKTIGRIGFIRSVPFVPGGVVLIDASGSMRPSAALLNQLCAIMPAARVMFYNGNGNMCRNIEGQIVTYAVGGRRADSVPPDTLYWSGNTIDLQAVNFALSFPGPHVLVSDLAFCEGKPGDAEIAEIIARNRFTKIHASLEQAVAYYTGRKTL